MHGLAALYCIESILHCVQVFNEMRWQEAFRSGRDRFYEGVSLLINANDLNTNRNTEQQENYKTGHLLV
jgi:hypothetical protein